MKWNTLFAVCLALSISIIGCGGNSTDDDIFFGETETGTQDSQVLPRVGFELIELVAADEILVWINDEALTQEEFDAIDLTANFFKNEPREGDPDGSSFSRSPDAAEDGQFTTREQFGYQWLFNAQVIEQNVLLPDNNAGLLTGRNIAKFHQVRFNAGRTIFVLVSPDGDEYVRISRDANRTDDIPTIPESWRIEERVTINELLIELPNPTLNIRAENNQDSFQGPVTI